MDETMADRVSASAPTHYHVIETSPGRLPAGEPLLYARIEEARAYARERSEHVRRELAAAGGEHLVVPEGELCYRVVHPAPPSVERVLRVSACTDPACLRRR